MVVRLDGDDLELAATTATSAPGLYVVGRFFQTAVASSHLGWVGNDAGYVAGRIAARAPAANPPVSVQGR